MSPFLHFGYFSFNRVSKEQLRLFALFLVNSIFDQLLELVGCHVGFLGLIGGRAGFIRVQSWEEVVVAVDGQIEQDEGSPDQANASRQKHYGQELGAQELAGARTCHKLTLVARGEGSHIHLAVV